MVSIKVFGCYVDTTISISDAWAFARIEFNQRLVFVGRQGENPFDANQLNVVEHIQMERKKLFSFILEHQPELHRHFVNTYISELKAINNDYYLIEDIEDTATVKKTGLLFSIIELLNKPISISFKMRGDTKGLSSK